MKKLFTLFAAAAMIVSFSSCKKDYTCTCTVDGDTYTYPLKDVKKKDANAACESAGSVWLLVGGSCSID